MSADRSHQTDWTLMVKISQKQTPVGSIQGGFPLSRVKTNPDDDDDDDDDDVSIENECDFDDFTDWAHSASVLRSRTFSIRSCKSRYGEFSSKIRGSRSEFLVLYVKSTTSHCNIFRKLELEVTAKWTWVAKVRKRVVLVVEVALVDTPNKPSLLDRGRC